MKYINVSTGGFMQHKEVEVSNDFYIFFKEFYKNKYKKSHNADIELARMVSVEKEYYNEALKEYKLRNNIKDF